jgi:hypothetical protein
MSSKKISSSQSMSDKLRADWECPRCSGLLLYDVIFDENVDRHNVWKCVSCGNCIFTEATTQKDFSSRSLPPIHSPITVAKPSKSTRTRETPIVLRKVSIQNLSPPPVPRTDEDLNGAYEIQCNTYAGYKHFQQQAEAYRNKVKRCRKKNTKLECSYRARLCENLARTLGQIYLRQDSSTLRQQLRKQRRIGHALKQTNGRVTYLFKTYSALMLQAMTLLKNDQLVQEWRGSRVVLGGRKYLRKARKGLEKGVLAYKSGQEALADLTTIELGMEGHSDGEIRATLKAQGLPARSREGIRKRLKPMRVRVTLLSRRSSILPT